MMEMHGSEPSTGAPSQCRGSGPCPTTGRQRKVLRASSKDSTRFDFIITAVSALLSPTKLCYWLAQSKL